MSERPTEEQIRAGMRRPGARSGAYGVRYLTGGYYLSPDQFGFSTAQQGPTAGMAGGEMSTATGGVSSGGDSGGAST